jgi:hypothetical protein
MIFPSAETNRAKGRRLLRELLQIEPNAEQLLEVAGEALGSERLSRCVGRVREAAISRRAAELSNLAAIVAGVQVLGPAWWQTPHHRQEKPDKWEGGPAPDAVLSDPLRTREQYPTALGLLEWWISDDVADRLWGPPVDVVDLNSLVSTNRIRLPPGVRVGERLVVSFDPGSRIDAEVVEVDGVLGSELDLKTCRHAPPAEAAWAWEIGAGPGPHRLSGESGSNDPYSAPVDQAVGAELLTWALKHGMEESETGYGWNAAAYVVTAIAAAETAYRPGRWHFWEQAAWALVDGDSRRLADALAMVRSDP